MHEIPARDLMMRFESFGDNCEFGIAQRGLGAEPQYDLLRWASATLSSVTQLVAADFAGLGTDDDLEIYVGHQGREFMARSRRYGMNWHPWRNPGQMSDVAVKRQEVRRIQFLIPLERERLQEGRRILVLRCAKPLREEDVRPLLGEIRRYGRCPLLFVRLAESEAPGSVEWLGDSVMRGHIGRFADPEDVAADTDATAWGALCRNALDSLMCHEPEFARNV